jgi:predicted nucleotidyltransferase
MKFGLPSETIETIHRILRQHRGVEQAIIYGSRAKGTDRAGSDIDLTLIGEQLSYEDLLQIMRELYESAIPYTVDVSLFDDIEDTAVRQHIRRWGQVFYERSEQPS